MATEHHIASTNDIDNSTKKYTFSNSQLFALGVTEDGFANSFAMQICAHIKNDDKFDIIEIDIVKEANGVVTSTNSYEYELKKIKQGLPEYLKLKTFISDFVVDIYNKNYSGCLERIDFDDKEKFKIIIDDIYEGFNKDYSDTLIVDYKSKGDSYSIYGMIKSKSDKLDLFTMELKKDEDSFKLISFYF